MKTLIIIRHAKSSWNDPALDDFDRPLNERGKRDAPRMGKRLKEKGISPDLLLSSPARRAFSTAKKIAKELKFKKENIKTDRKLYHADEEIILEVIKSVKDKHQVLLVFGHNPGLTEFVNTLQDGSEEIENIPTCGIAAFQINIDSWSELSWGKARMIFFDFPKSRED